LLAADAGFYSAKNEAIAKARGVTIAGISKSQSFGLRAYTSWLNWARAVKQATSTLPSAPVLPGDTYFLDGPEKASRPDDRRPMIDPA
jgi:hypothetical protein